MTFGWYDFLQSLFLDQALWVAALHTFGRDIGDLEPEVGSPCHEDFWCVGEKCVNPASFFVDACGRE
jgi:hypothetical protein